MLILSDVQTTSAEVGLEIGAYQAIVAGHAGGTWVTEYQPAAGEPWIDLDVDFDGDGVQRFVAVHAGRYRIRGGTVGAKAWIVSEVGAGVTHLADGS